MTWKVSYVRVLVTLSLTKFHRSIYCIAFTLRILSHGILRISINNRWVTKTLVHFWNIILLGNSIRDFFSALLKTKTWKHLYSVIVLENFTVYYISCLFWIFFLTNYQYLQSRLWLSLDTALHSNFVNSHCKSNSNMKLL